MHERLKREAESLLTRADRAVDQNVNGLPDREGLVRLILLFSQFTRAVLDEFREVELQKDDLARRLLRSAPVPEPGAGGSGAEPTNSDSPDSP